MSSRSTGLAPAKSILRDPLKLPPRPLPMRVAFWLQLADVVASCVPFVFQLVTFNAAAWIAKGEAEAARKHERVFSGSTYVSGFIFEMVIFAAIIAALLLLTFLVRRGLNWARIILTAETGLPLLIIIGGVDAYGVVRLLADLAVVVLVWLPASNDYFRAARSAIKLHKSQRPVSLRSAT